MEITFSKNPFVRLSVWFNNTIIHWIKELYYKNRKAHYQCCVCGRIIAPYFDKDESHHIITDDYGWHKLDNGKYNRWICHHCADHGFSPSDVEGEPYEVPREFTWDEWQDIIKHENKKVMDLIKEKDPEYYDYWFGDCE